MDNETVVAWKNLIKRNKTKIAVGVTAAVTFTVCARISRYAVGQRDDFLREHGLLDAFNAQFEED